VATAFRVDKMRAETSFNKIGFVQKFTCKNSLDGVRPQAKSAGSGGVRQRGGETMDNMSPSYRTDQQLEAIIAETGEWAVVGSNDRLLCRAASLRHAIEKALDQMFGPHVVIALVRRPSDHIVVFADQMFRIWERIITSEMPKDYQSIFSLSLGADH
jgi:hypothetical protein